MKLSRRNYFNTLTSQYRFEFVFFSSLKKSINTDVADFVEGFFIYFDV